MLTYKQKPISDFQSLIQAFSDKDLASPFRSTVPLLAYWKKVSSSISEFTDLIDIEKLTFASVEFEYGVSTQKGKGPASRTDLMLLTAKQTIAIEAKYTEGRYENVDEWLRKPGLDSHQQLNRQQVLIGWLTLINRAAGTSLQPKDVHSCTYQLIHRTASACHPQGALRRIR